MTTPAAAEGRGTGTGLVIASLTYAAWGVFPLYFLLLADAGEFEIVGWRVVCTLGVCLLLLAAARGWRRLGAILRRPRTVLLMGVAGVLIFVNWQTYLVATLNGEVLQAALGYFVNPIVTVLLGVLVLRERLRPAQWVAVALSGVAVLVIVLGGAGIPWFSFILAASFGCYGLVKRRVGGSVDALSGLTLETAWLLPVAIVQLVAVGVQSGGLAMTGGDPVLVLLLLSTGLVTAVPLLGFAAAARRLPLTVIGLAQYITPVLQFLVGVLLLHEHMPLSRWVGFGIVWVALAVLSADLLLAVRARRRPGGAAPRSALQ